MQARLRTLQDMRYRGVRSSTYEGQSVTYGSDAELASAIRDLEGRIAVADSTTRRRRVRRVYAVKDL